MDKVDACSHDAKGLVQLDVFGCAKRRVLNLAITRSVVPGEWGVCRSRFAEAQWDPLVLTDFVEALTKGRA
ncbi:hypothetical protein CRG98_014307 [Punica granatum]|uniref:Uncharacterized protein n=1 Tax=Punica granatum TaxID=22663 RepID=A0A2I0K9Q0_PUNGR|nr:hypothetical protein CRG98_014307 [Punica granatum]